MPKPMLGDLELQLVQEITAQTDRRLVQHEIPGLEGDFWQRQNRHGGRFFLNGVLTGPEAGQGLKALRDKFKAAEPVSFVADIATATRVDQVLIEKMGLRELAGKPERFEYAFTLREYRPIAEIETEQPPPSAVDDAVAEDSAAQTAETVSEVADEVGELRVEVTLTGSNQDFSNLVVSVEGSNQTGEAIFFTIEEQTAGVYTRLNVPAGEYQVRVIRR